MPYLCKYHFLSSGDFFSPKFYKLGATHHMANKMKISLLIRDCRSRFPFHTHSATTHLEFPQFPLPFRMPPSSTLSISRQVSQPINSFPALADFHCHPRHLHDLQKTKNARECCRFSLNFLRPLWISSQCTRSIKLINYKLLSKSHRRKCRKKTFTKNAAEPILCQCSCNTWKKALPSPSTQQFQLRLWTTISLCLGCCGLKSCHRGVSQLSWLSLHAACC